MEQWLFHNNILSYKGLSNGRRWYMDGFLLSSEILGNLRNAYGLEIHCKKQEKPIQLFIKGYGYMNRPQLNEEMVIYPKINREYPKDQQMIRVSFDSFEFPKDKQLFWQFISHFEFTSNTEIYDVKILKGTPLRVHSDCYSKHGRAGEVLDYELLIENTSNNPVYATIFSQKYSWETCHVNISNKQIQLSPFEQKLIKISVKVGKEIVAAGREKQTICIVPNGDSDQQLTIELITGCAIQHPFIIHDSQGWDRVKEKVNAYDWAKKDFSAYEKIANEWKPKKISADFKPSVEDQHSNKGFIHPLQAEHCLNTAIAYKLTGNRYYAKKCYNFLKLFIEEYPGRNQAGVQALVQEGHLFQHLAMTCDLLWEENILLEQEKEIIERCFRDFMGIVDKELYIGGISNHYLAEIVGCLACALHLQDAERIERFLYGQSGMMEHLSRGVFDDGWYFECTLGYNLWVSVLYLQTGFALSKFGYYILDEKVPARYNYNVNISKTEKYGIKHEQWGEKTLNYRNIEMLVDSLTKYADYRGIVFAMNDSHEQPIYEKRHGFRAYDLAYMIYKKPEYGYLASLSPDKDCIYGENEYPAFDGAKLYTKSTYSSNAGYAVLRNKNGNDRERIQAVMRYGSHGGYHGHFDRLSLLSLMRYGKSVYYPEFVWYGYGSHLYKFLVQNSVLHNMTVVDGKNQEAVEAELIHFSTENEMQVMTARVQARWSNPPYGGMQYGYNESFQEKAFNEGRTFAFPTVAPEYGELTEYSEPIEQIRTMVLTDDYLIIRDQLNGKNKHNYDYMFHAQGLKEMVNLTKINHLSQLDENPLSSGQFITDCDVYTCGTNVKLHFDMDLQHNKAEAKIRYQPNKAKVKLDLHIADARSKQVIIGRSPVNQQVHQKVYYELWQDNELIVEGKTGAWILGEANINQNVKVGKLILKIKVEKFADTNPDAHIYLVGLNETFKQLNREIKNAKISEKNRVIIEGTHYNDFICISPKNEDKSVMLEWEVETEGVFTAKIGCDYPVKENKQEYKTVAIRSDNQTETEFVTLIELYEMNPIVNSINYDAHLKQLQVNHIDDEIKTFHFQQNNEFTVKQD